MLTEAAPAKINLYLHVTGKRADGYHLLDSLVVFAGVGDEITAAPDEALSLAVAGPFSAGLAGETDNLVLRAARALAEAGGIAPRARLVLRKNLPVASGIGGGSADAAATLRLLARLWGLDLPAAEMQRIALRLGADVPVCLAGRPARMAGIGEVLTAAPCLPPCGLVLVNPGVATPTPEVFRARTAAFTPAAAMPEAWADAHAMAQALGGMTNGLQDAAISRQPVIADVLAAIAGSPDCLLARMSGSGATCFGLYADAGQAEAAARGLARAGWWTWGGALAPT